MIKKFAKSIFRATGIRNFLNAARKVLSWALGIPKEKDPRGLEVKQEGSDIAFPVVYGERMVGGIVVHKWVTNSITGISGIENETRDNAYLHLIIALCHGEVEEVGTIFFNGERETVSKYSNKYAAFKYTGTENQQASSQAVANIPNWNSNMRGRNVAYMYLVLYQDKDQSVWQGEPEIQVVIKGRKVYDPRTDQIAYSENNALAALDLLLNPIYGRGASMGEIAMQDFAAAADFCEEGTESTTTTTRWEDSGEPGVPPIQFTETTTTTSPRYRIACNIDTDQDVFVNYRELLQSFRAFPRRPNGLISLGVEDVAPSEFEIYDEGELEGSLSYGQAGERERFNRFTVRFPNKNDRFERDEFTYPQPDDPLYDEWLAEDNGKELLGELEVNSLSSTDCAAQHAEIAAKSSRLDGRLTTTLPARGRLQEAGDIIGINSDTFGWTAKPFRIQRIFETENNTFQVELSEHEDAAYTWSGVAWNEIIGGTWLGNPSEPAAPTNLQLFEDTTLATGGRLTWAAVNDSFVREYEVVILDEQGEQIKDDRTRGTAYTMPLLDVGEYVVQVYSVTTLNIRSQPASLLVNYAIPIPPTDLGLSASNNAITSEPFLAGAGLGTTWEYDIDDLSDSEFEPSPRLRGGSAVFTGRIPNTEYRVWVRTINALGASDWVSETITTSLDVDEQRPIVEQLLADPTITGPVTEAVFQRTERAKQRVADARVNIIEEGTNALKVAREARERVAAIKGERLARVTGFIEVQEDLSNETEQRVLQINGIVATLDNEIANRQSAILSVQEAIADESSARATDIQIVNSRIDTETNEREADITTVTEAISDESSTRASQIQSVNSRVDDETAQRESDVTTLTQSINDEATTRAQQITTVTGSINTLDDELNAQSILIQDITVDVDGNAQVIAGLSAQFDSVEQDVSGISDLILASGLNADGETNATAALSATIEDLEGDLAGQAQLILDVEQGLDDNTSSLATLSTTVQGLGDQQGDFAQALVTLESDTDDLKARAVIGTTLNTDGSVTFTGITIQDDGVERVIEFALDKARFLRPDLTPFIVFDTEINEAVFDGRITAETVQGVDLIGNNITGANIRGSRYTVEESGSDFFEVKGSPPFGSSGNLYIWYGRKTSATWDSQNNEAILSGLSTVNSINHTTTNGSVYFGGVFQAGTISISLQNTQLINDSIIDTGSYNSQGAQIQIAASFSHSAFDILTGTCPTVQQPTGTLFIEQGNTAGTTWTVVAQVPVTGQTNTSQEGGECVIDSNAGATATFTDNQMSTSNRRYRARISVSGMYRGGDTENQSLSIISTEE